MKIKKSQLRRIILEEVQRLHETQSGEDPRAMYDRMVSLEKKYASDWQKLKSIDYSKQGYLDDDAWERLLSLRDSTDNYGDFFNAVSRRFNRSTGRHEKTNEFHLMASYARAVFNNETGYPLAELKKAHEEFKKLKPRFRSSDGTDMSDSVYGRRRTNVVFVHDDGSEEVISSKVNRRGSLGT